MAGLGKIVGTRNALKTIRCAKATYDVTNSIHSGVAATAVGLGVVIPSGAIVTRVIGSAVTAFASLGAPTVAINLGSTEVNAATAFNHGDYTGVDVHYSTPVKLAADSEINIDVENAADLTGGVYDIYVEYIL